MRKDYLAILLHSSLWLLLFLFPLITLNGEYLIYRNWLSLSSIFIVFYINYFVLVDFFFLKNKKTQFYISNALLIILLYYLLNFLLKFKLFHPTVNGEIIREVRSGAMTTVQVILPIILSIGMCVGLKINTQFNKNQLALQQSK